MIRHQSLGDVEGLTGAILVHGLPNTGKTHLCGAALAIEKAFGLCAYLHVQGEPSLETIRAHDVEGVEIYTVEALEDIAAWAKENEKAKKRYHFIALDSLAALAELSEEKETGGKHAPGNGAGDGRKEWGNIKYGFKNALTLILRSATLCLMTCPSALTTVEEGGSKVIAPDLIGKDSYRILFRCSFAGYMSLQTINNTTVNRSISFEPRVDALTRCNAKRAIAKSLPLPSTANSWSLVKNLLTTALTDKK